MFHTKIKSIGLVVCLALILTDIMLSIHLRYSLHSRSTERLCDTRSISACQTGKNSEQKADRERLSCEFPGQAHWKQGA